MQKQGNALTVDKAALMLGKKYRSKTVAIPEMALVPPLLLS